MSDTSSYHKLSLHLLFFIVSWSIYANAQFDETDESAPRCVVNIPNFGRVQGSRDEGIDFYGGIPYATPPVGDLRYAPPEPPPPWASAKLDATHYGPDCWQLEDPLANPTASAEHMSEDCLYLNIFTPDGHATRSSHWKNSKLLPVMVWLHGGAFQQGAARRPEYDGRRLAERGVIIVTLNYRLGVLGFLVSSPDGVYGNFGLMDQRAALHWIHDNISAFGGDPDNITLFGESSGAVMAGLHLMMDGVGTLFHRVIMQSNPQGYTFRSVVVADFIGEAFKRRVDCRDLACLRAERVEETMRAQSSLMGVPRSVGDFFTWGPTLTQEKMVTLGRATPASPLVSYDHRLYRNLDSARWKNERDTAWCAVNVSQPAKNLHLIPKKIPILIGSNKHEGEMFVHSAFPLTMSKPVYWMFVGALFRDSASRVLKHYRGFVDKVEKEAEDLARKQIQEEENKIFYLENREQLEHEYKLLLAMNATESSSNIVPEDGMEALVRTWSIGGAMVPNKNQTVLRRDHHNFWPFGNIQQQIAHKARIHENRRRARENERKRERALKEAAKIVVDYRPVMSRIIDDYLFRCPSWHFAHKVSQNRAAQGNKNNVYVYRFSQPTHIPGFKECWGKSCHTAELPFVFQAIDVIRSNYSTLSDIAQKEAPSTPEYPYTEIIDAYQGVLEASDQTEGEDFEDPVVESKKYPGEKNTTHTKAFQRLLKNLFGDYFTEDADEEIANDMAERWVSFARRGNPNYEGSKAKWLPWRYIPSEDLNSEEMDMENVLYSHPNEYHFMTDFDLSNEEEDIDEASENFIWSEDREERLYRRRALEALSMEVVEEDIYRTELRRKKHTNMDAAFNFWYGLDRSKREHSAKQISKRTVRQVQKIAQDIGVLGTGLRGEPQRLDPKFDENFFPELLELQWPPEGRLVERDCTCDMWDKIGYRY